MENIVKNQGGGVLLSIIIPCYNCEKFLPDCLNSVINQNIDKSNYEIICVNDGSKDNTLSILREYEKNHSNITVIDKENGGVSSARNVGVNNCRGRYIWFVDSDDMVQPNVALQAVNCMVEMSLDIMMFNYQVIDSDFKYENISDEFESEIGDLREVENIKALHPMRIDKKEHFDACWGLLIDCNYIKTNNIVFNEKMIAGEDVIWFYEIKKNAAKYKYLDKKMYYYRISPDSLTRLKNDEKTKKYQHGMKVLAEFWKEELKQGYDVKENYDLAVAQCTYMLLSIKDKEWVANERKNMRQEGLYPPKLNLKLIHTKKGKKQFIIDIVRSALHFKILFWLIYKLYKK